MAGSDPSIPSEAGTTQFGTRRPGLTFPFVVAALGCSTTLLVYLWLYKLQSYGQSAAALAMSEMDMKDMQKYWSFPILQASGLTGLVFAYFSVLLGLGQSGSAFPRIPWSHEQLNRYHRHVSLLVVALVIVHMAATAADAMGDSWKTVLIPSEWAQAWPEAVWGYNTGIVASYLLVVLGPTFYVRGVVSAARWRFLHRFVLAFYILSFWHAMILGLDIAYYAWIRPTMWLSQIPLLYLLGKRLQRSIRDRDGATGLKQALMRLICRALVAASAIAGIAILTVVISGHSDLIATV